MTPLPLVVTTAISPTQELEGRAGRLAQELGGQYVPRRRVTLAQVARETGALRLLIAERERLRLWDAEGVEYFFHPNMALIRGYSLMRGDRDLFAEATGLAPGDRLLDCTLGFAAEATLGSWLVGASGQVVGLESEPVLAAVTRAGVAQFPLQSLPLQEAMRRIIVVTADYGEYLPQCETASFDVVYFDPFFDERLSGAEPSVSPLAHFGNQAPLIVDAVREARRVASRRVVIKHPKHEALPEVLSGEVSAVVSTRKSRLQYDILPAW